VKRIEFDPTCPICNVDIESSLHIFRDCQFVMKLWQQLLGCKNLNSFIQGNIVEWIETNILDKSCEWRFKFVVTLDCVWKTRNMIIFENKHISISELVNRICCRTQELVEVSTLKIYHSPPNTEVTESDTSWVCPPLNWVKLNCDGVVNQGGLSASCGGVIQNSDEEFISAFSVRLGGCTIITAELVAIFHGIKLALDKGHNRINQDKVADALTKWGLNQDTPSHYFDVVPNFCNSVLLADRAGMFSL